jgi:predicted metalloprotease with PDZ domain
MRKVILFLGCILSLNCLALDSPLLKSTDSLNYQVNYTIRLDPKEKGAHVSIHVDRGDLLWQLSFDNKNNRYTQIKLDEQIKLDSQLSEKNNRVIWDLPKNTSNPSTGATLHFFTKINHERDLGKYDAIMTKEWAIFRGDDVIPSVHIHQEDGATAMTRLRVILPEGWTSVETGWKKISDNEFLIDNPERDFDRPTGWIIAGNLASVRTRLSGTRIVVASPKGQDFRRMELLTFLHFVWPKVHQAFVTAPKKLLLVGADDPMWRGGLSAANSLYLHSDRRIVSENGTSPLVHELVHMMTRIQGIETDKTNDDWIAEGLAEFYSFELLYRAHGINKSRRKNIIESLSTWGAEIKHLRKGPSTGPVTARAVVLINELDQEIRLNTKEKYSIDDVTRQLMIKRKVSLEDLNKVVESLLGKKSKVLMSPLLG